jgi:hypothetical protein
MFWALAGAETLAAAAAASTACDFRKALRERSMI